MSISTVRGLILTAMNLMDEEIKEAQLRDFYGVDTMRLISLRHVLENVSAVFVDKPGDDVIRHAVFALNHLREGQGLPERIIVLETARKMSVEEVADAQMFIDQKQHTVADKTQTELASG